MARIVSESLLLHRTEELEKTYFKSEQKRRYVYEK